MLRSRGGKSVECDSFGGDAQVKARIADGSDDVFKKSVPELVGTQIHTDHILIDKGADI